MRVFGMHESMNNLELVTLTISSNEIGKQQTMYEDIKYKKKLLDKRVNYQQIIWAQYILFYMDLSLFSSAIILLKKIFRWQYTVWGKDYKTKLTQ